MELIASGGVGASGGTLTKSAVAKMTQLTSTGPAGSGHLVVPAHRRRVVAITASPMELLRPESDLARMIEGVPHVDLLVATDDLPVAAPNRVGVLGDAGGPHLQWPGDDDGDSEDGVADLPDEFAGRIPPGLHVHRLRLRAPLTGLAEDDLVAALSELVGFDPEPGVYCLAPQAAAGDPARAVMSSAAQRIAQVYGLPLLRYRCLELCVVGECSS